MSVKDNGWRLPHNPPMLRRHVFRWLIWFWLASVMGAAAQGLPEGLAELRIDVLRDPGAQLAVGDLPALGEHFTPLHGGVLNAGFTRDAFWLRISIQRRAGAPREWRLEVRPAFLDDLRLYTAHADQDYRMDRQGDRLPYSARPFRYRNPLFTLELPDESRQQFYLRVASTSSLMVIPSVTTPEVFRERAQFLLIGLSLFFGVMIAMIGVNLLYAIALRDVFFGAYGVFLALELLGFVNIEGLLAQLFFQDTPNIPDRLVGLSTYCSFGLGMILFRQFVRIRHHLPRLDRIVVFAAAFEFVVSLSALTDYFSLLAPFGQLLILPAALITLVAAIKATRTGESGAGFVAAGYFAHIAFIGYSALSHVGAFAAGVDPYLGLYISVTTQLLFFQIGITARAHQAERTHLALLERAQTAQEHAAKERQLRETQSQFLNMVAHEVRTPLAVITAATNTLRLLGETPPQVAERIARIERSARRMGKLFELCLAAEQIDAPQDTPQLEPVSLSSLLTETAAEHGLEPGARLRIEDQTGGRKIQADPRLLKIAFSNLIDNAAKYSAPDQPVEVRIHAEKTEQDSPGIAIDVIDRGPGVPVEVRARIFEKYFRADERSGVPGLGLGLYLTRRIVESHGGSVSVLDGPGGQFRIHLPADK